MRDEIYKAIIDNGGTATKKQIRMATCITSQNLKIELIKILRQGYVEISGEGLLAINPNLLPAFLAWRKKI